MTASPHVAAAGSHYLNLLLPIIGLNHRSPIITSTGYNARAAAANQRMAVAKSSARHHEIIGLTNAVKDLEPV